LECGPFLFAHGLAVERFLNLDRPIQPINFDPCPSLLGLILGVLERGFGLE
jgi:hypothetical protein